MKRRKKHGEQGIIKALAVEALRCGADMIEVEYDEGSRAGRIPSLEQAVKCNLAKASRILRILRFHADALNLKPSMTVCKRKTAGGKIPLRFSKSGSKISRRLTPGILSGSVR
jgi:hypothetical protein